MGVMANVVMRSCGVRNQQNSRASPIRTFVAPVLHINPCSTIITEEGLLAPSDFFHADLGSHARTKNGKESNLLSASQSAVGVDSYIAEY